MTRLIFSLSFLSFILLIFLVPSFGSSFTVDPVKLELVPGISTTPLKLKNEAKEKVTVRISVKRWSQFQNGEDTYEDTEDIVFFPSVATLEAGEEKIVKVGYQGTSEPILEEKPYRLFIEEVPSKKSKDETLLLALRLVIPLFVAPHNDNGEEYIESVVFTDDKLSVKVTNESNHHIFTSKIRAVGVDTSGSTIFSVEGQGWYLHSGLSKTYSLDVPSEFCSKTREIKIYVDEGSNKTLEFNLDSLDPSLCNTLKSGEVGESGCGGVVSDVADPGFLNTIDSSETEKTSEPLLLGKDKSSLPNCGGVSGVASSEEPSTSGEVLPVEEASPEE
ncbi:MAG: molecular chaperone [Deltaproteobacteria bacterium]|nr:molecular chaperone [Deltaproteobacteria bacterium]